MPKPTTLLLFNYDWDDIATRRLRAQWPSVHSGFDLFTFPSNARLAWFDVERFVGLCALKAKLLGARAVMSNHEQFGALCAALIAEKMGWPGTPVNAILACQHKLYARKVLQRVAPEANLKFERLPARYGEPIPNGLAYPCFVKPVKAAFSVLAKTVHNQAELQAHTRFGPWELWVIRHLVEPFERIIQKRLPQAGTAHSLMLEEAVNARQYNLDGYVWQGEVQPLGVVDEVMYPNTQAFMRFEYPSRLPARVQRRAADVAQRFLDAIGFTHGLFNMEFFYCEQSDRLTVIEFNPRMASQFSDLYQRVDGINLHEIAFALAHGQNPAMLTKDAPTAGAAASFVYRLFDPALRATFPDSQARQQFAQAFPDALYFEFPKDGKQIERDFKWLQSYRYGIVHLGGQTSSDLRQRCEQASHLLGWPAPYAGEAWEWMNTPHPKGSELFGPEPVSKAT
ncbi:acetyl-CoA carboxylase biotin carboxylase subunit family protein [Limnobacter sp.]|uniref:ATP-grasp domain-containing protein n=1 Tax=Limnobacter sp. TaxID=2003368 RepID=UPI00351972B2